MWEGASEACSVRRVREFLIAELHVVCGWVQARPHHAYYRVYRLLSGQGVTGSHHVAVEYVNSRVTHDLLTTH